jgi:hypothetical protein
MQKLLAFFIIPLFTMAMAAGTSTRSATHRGGSGSSSAKATANQNRGSVSDGELESTIRTKLAKSKIGKDGFRFHVQRGVVTWEGTTAVGQHKGAATRMARTAGAVEVINNIRVSTAGKGTPMRKAYVQP